MKSTADMSFDELLNVALDDTGASEEIERRFGQKVAILVVDFSSMRRRTDAFGIIHTLATIRQAFHVYTPAVHAHGGTLIKTVADTLFVVFDTPESALAAALDGHHRLDQFNRDRGGDIHAGVPGAPIHPKSGLGWGDTLVLPDENLYGAEVNRAFILGEDVAWSREILASTDFADAIGVPPPGVGVFSAPHDRVHDAGFPFHIFRDHRE